MEASAVSKTLAARPLLRTIVYTRTANGPVMVPLLDQESKDEESAAEYQLGGYLPIAVDDRFAQERYLVVRKLGCDTFWIRTRTTLTDFTDGGIFLPFGLLKTHCRIDEVYRLIAH